MTIQFSTAGILILALLAGSIVSMTTIAFACPYPAKRVVCQPSRIYER